VREIIFIRMACAGAQEEKEETKEGRKKSHKKYHSAGDVNDS